MTTPELLGSVYLILRRCKEMMPDTIGLIGFDSQEWSRMVSPSVTTIVQPAYEEGAAASRLIVDLLEEKGEELPNQIFECSILQGETTISCESGQNPYTALDKNTEDQSNTKTSINTNTNTNINTDRNSGLKTKPDDEEDGKDFGALSVMAQTETI